MESPTPMIEGTDNDDKLREQVMINQFCNQVGCPPEMAVEILQAARWQIEVAFSIFFQGHAVASSNSANANNGNPHYLDNSSFDTNCSSASGGGSSFGSRMSYACVPTNTPATPPAFPDTLAAFSQLKASSPDQRSTGFESRIVHLQKT